MVPRPALLAIALAVVLAGCAGGVPATPTGSDATTAAPTTGNDASAVAPTTEAATPPTTTGHYARYEFTVAAVTRTDIATSVALTRDGVADGVTWRDEPFVRDLFADRRATRVAIDASTDGAPGPLANGSVVRENGTFLRLRKTVVDRREGEAWRMRVEGPLRPDQPDYERATEAAVDLNALSDADRRLVTFVVPRPEHRTSGYHSRGYLWVFPAGDDPSASRLVDGERHYVRSDGDVYRVRAEAAGTAVRHRVRYDLDRVADSARAFADEHAAAYVTRLNDSTVDPPARGVLEATVRNGSVGWEGRGDRPERYRAAAQWITEHPPRGSTAYVRRDGRLYRLTVSALRS